MLSQRRPVKRRVFSVLNRRCPFKLKVLLVLYRGRRVKPEVFFDNFPFQLVEHRYSLTTSRVHFTPIPHRHPGCHGRVWESAGSDTQASPFPWPYHVPITCSSRASQTPVTCQPAAQQSRGSRRAAMPAFCRSVSPMCPTFLKRGACLLGLGRCRPQTHMRTFTKRCIDLGCLCWKTEPLHGFFVPQGLLMLLVWFPWAGTFHLIANVGGPNRSPGCLAVAPNRCSVAEAQGLHVEIRNVHHGGRPCDGIKAASQLSETLISLGPVLAPTGDGEEPSQTLARAPLTTAELPSRDPELGLNRKKLSMSKAPRLVTICSPWNSGRPPLSWDLGPSPALEQCPRRSPRPRAALAASRSSDSVRYRLTAFRSCSVATTDAASMTRYM